ncbi:hypothetical protein K474DRAFT_1721647 [Panus rudis PR-1116 ss-1]|nr:hypothetical protein K474DRAFT_1721647 [Panus rudis PR-1116 ss-1]
MSYATYLALLVYDTVLTFPQEVRCIWQRKWNGAVLLYAATRYITILDIGIQLLAALVVPTSVQVCFPVTSDIHYIMQYGTGVGRLWFCSTFESLRVWAISRKGWILASAVLVLNILAPAIDIVSVGLVVRGGAICADIIVLFATFHYTAQTVRIGHGISVNTHYTSLLLYTGRGFHLKYYSS